MNIILCSVLVRIKRCFQLCLLTDLYALLQLMPDFCQHLHKVLSLPLWLSGCYYVKHSHNQSISVSVFLRFEAQIKCGVYLNPQYPQFFLSPFLVYFKIEERAIQDLLFHYKARNNPDEFIVVERSSRGPIATPTWNKH